MCQPLVVLWRKLFKPVEKLLVVAEYIHKETEFLDGHNRMKLVHLVFLKEIRRLVDVFAPQFSSLLGPRVGEAKQNVGDVFWYLDLVDCRFCLGFHGVILSVRKMLKD